VSFAEKYAEVKYYKYKQRRRNIEYMMRLKMYKYKSRADQERSSNFLA